MLHNLHGDIIELRVKAMPFSHRISSDGLCCTLRMSTFSQFFADWVQVWFESTFLQLHLRVGGK